MRSLKIRPAGPTDVGALRALLGRAGAIELTTHTWPKVEPESGHLPILGVLGQAFGPRLDRRGIWVAADAGRLEGFLIAAGRCEGLVWDVNHLHAVGEQSAIDLLEHTCGAAADAGALRVFLDVPAESPGVALARRAGFERYAGAQLLKLKAPFKIDRSNAFSARPRLRADEQQLFQLYNASVPAPVRAAEALTYDEWSALHRGSRRWRPSLFGDRHQFVWEMGAGLVGWFEVVYGQKSQFLDFMIQARYENLLDQLVGYALTQVSEKAPVYAAPRDHQAVLVSALRRAGFEPTGDVEILVRQLAARAPQPSFAPANAVGG